ncbi:hypothetical protein, partial [Salinispira pacifica]
MVYQFTAYSYIELFSAVVVALLLGMVASRPWERSAPPLTGLAASVLFYVATTTFRQAGLIPSVTLLWTQFRYLAEVVIAPSAILFSLSCCIA